MDHLLTYGGGGCCATLEGDMGCVGPGLGLQGSLIPLGACGGALLKGRHSSCTDGE